MCMRPCGPVRRSYSRSSRGIKRDVKVEYWAEMSNCSSAEVGNIIAVPLYSSQIESLRIAMSKGESTGIALYKQVPEITEEISAACRKHLLRQMALDVYDSYDFSDPRFKGMRKEAKIRHIMSEAANEHIQFHFKVQEID